MELDTIVPTAAGSVAEEAPLPCAWEAGAILVTEGRRALPASATTWVH